MSKYLYSVFNVAGDIVDEMQFDSYQDCIRNLRDELVLDEHEEIIDGDIEAVFIYKVTDDFIRVHYQVDELTGDGLTDKYEVCRITR